MPGDKVLDVRIESKRRGGHAVLADVAFTARPGEVVALFGASGVGKSTALRIVLGLDRDFQGRVKLPSGIPGVMFQEPRLLPWLTVAGNLHLVAPHCDAKALLAEVRLDGVAAKRPKSLSLGMARRAALARAFAVAPKLLVLDEPFASLDARLAAALAGAIARRAREGGAIVLLATHDLDQVLGVATRALVLAGSPAHLAADEAVPRGDGGVWRAGLLARFPFLAAGDAHATEG